ncbi:MAG: fibronectin type III domain-containing protein [Planctomycetales bacterium]|nr:fibronectin type III domain-containing protein [bacterium]UNM09164.1 MAG: fibronectin type III domain-containing protein [Planctomycetales bacterium]
MQRVILLSCLAMLTVLAASCSGNGSGSSPLQPVDNTTGGLPQADSLGAIPQDVFSDEALRNASETFGYLLEGRDCFLTNGVENKDHSLLLQPVNADDSRFVVYRLPGIHPDAEIGKLEFVLSQQQPGQDIYFAVADYASGRWDFHRTVQSGDPYVFNMQGFVDLGRNLSPAFNVYIAILMRGSGSGLTVDNVVVSNDSDAPPAPGWFRAADGGSPYSVQLRWEDLDFPVSPVQVEFRDTTVEGSQFALLYETKGEYSYLHNSLSPVPCVPGVIYEYRMRYTLDGHWSPYSLPDTGFASLPTPLWMDASDGLHEDHVELHWPEAGFGHNARFSIYRDGEEIEDEVILTNQYGIFTYYDYTVTDYAAHAYDVYAYEAGETGLVPASDTGFRGNRDGSDILEAPAGELFHGGMALIANDTLGIAYNDTGNNALMFRALPGSLTGYSPLSRIDWATLPSDSVVLEQNGLPAVAWENSGGTVLDQGVYMAFSTKALPESDEDWIVETIELIKPTGDLAFAIIDGRPAVSYMHYNANTKQTSWRLAQRSGPLGVGGSWTVSDIVVLAQGEYVPHNFAMAEYNGRIAIAFDNQLPGGNLLAAHCMFSTDLSPVGSQDWVSHQVQTTHVRDMLADIGLQVLDGELQLACMVKESGKVYVITKLYRATSPFPAIFSDWEEFFADNILDHGVTHLALSSVAGKPVYARSSTAEDAALLMLPYRLPDAWLGRRNPEIHSGVNDILFTGFKAGYPGDHITGCPEAVSIVEVNGGIAVLSNSTYDGGADRQLLRLDWIQLSPLD